MVHGILSKAVPSMPTLEISISVPWARQRAYLMVCYLGVQVLRRSLLEQAIR
ncbi:Uncharacterised protein [Enterobacter cloacae]|uniref:Uncharacterized protein n=1 Tax=Enterobacter cloacae TaxID=550 RepID=A0A0M7IRV2_ENTCL|nr:hypothetical protein BJM06_02121 [Enterobacter cloacae]SSG93421.1 Uncharacterised protein [Klebsiella pneumoniae]KGB12538.1 hypothetical protein DR74_4070 [Enterobacter cloacae]CUJ27729.1 Uncharacterised protein [Enterobacter cloacae]STQ12107.1 Uncharacterised protein [Enterobacter cloacae]